MDSTLSNSTMTNDDRSSETRVPNGDEPEPRAPARIAALVPNQDDSTSDMKPALCIGGHFQLTHQDAESVKVQLKQEGAGVPQENKVVIGGCDSELMAFALGDCDAEDLLELSLRRKAVESSPAAVHINFDLKIEGTGDEPPHHEPDFGLLMEQRIQSRLLEDNESSSVRLVPDRLVLREASDDCATTFCATSGFGTVLLALPSSHEGGAVRLLPKRGGANPKTIAFGPLSSFTLPQWMAYRRDVASIELQPVTEGVQALLVFRIELVKASIREPSWLAQRYPVHCRHWVARNFSMEPANPNEPSG